MYADQKEKCLDLTVVIKLLNIESIYINICKARKPIEKK